MAKAQKADQLKRKEDNLLSTISFSGPLPPPQILEQYKKVDPDAVKIILDMAVRQNMTRTSNEVKIVESNVKTAESNSRLKEYGAKTARWITLIFLALGFYGLHRGQEVAAFLAFLPPVISALLGNLPRILSKDKK